MRPSAVEKNGGSVSFLQLQTYDNIGADAGNLVRTAINQGADGIAVPNWVPEAEDEAIKAAVAAGIPVMLYNAGNIDKAKELGAINYIGTDETLAGEAGGEYFAEHGAKNVICVNTVPGAANLEARCKGIIDGITGRGAGGQAAAAAGDELRQPDRGRRGDQGRAAEGPEHRQRHHDQPGDADTAANGIMQAGAAGRVELGGFDMNQTASTVSRTTRSSL